MSMIMILESLPADTKIAAEDKKLAAVGENTPSLTCFDENDLDDFDDEDDLEFSDNSFSLEKAWHGIHFLLTGDAWGGSGWRAFLVNGGTPQGPDHGYGPSRYFSATEVTEIAKELEQVSSDDLWAKFDGQAMNQADIYPGIWDEEADELQEEYLDYFEELKTFLNQISSDGEVLRITLT